MTVLVGWVRRLGQVDELVLAADSRNRGDGRVFDNCPKLMLLPRSDCIVGYAGYIGNSYPMMLQLSQAISSYGPARDRSMDITELRRHVLRVFDEIVSSIDHQTEQKTPSDFELVFGGYSWREKRFRLWRIVFEPKVGRFVAHRALAIGLPHHPGAPFSRNPLENSIGSILFAGDRAADARRRLALLVSDGSRLRRDSGRPHLDMEPAMVLRDMLLQAGPNETIGGPLQLLRVHQHQNSTTLAVWWPQDGARPPLRRYLLGRPLLSYERSITWALDVFSFRLDHEDFNALDAGHDLSFARGLFIQALAKRAIKDDWAPSPAGGLGR